MPRIPRGIQLGRRSPVVVTRALDLSLVGVVLMTVFFGFGLGSARLELREAGDPVSEAPPEPATLPAERVGEAAALLVSGVLDAPALSSALREVLDSAFSGVRITSVEMRSGGTPGFRASLAADAEDAEAVDALLNRLTASTRFEGISVISETRRRDGGITVRITFRLAAPA